MSDKELLHRDKMEVSAEGEPTYEGQTFTPAVDIYEDPTRLVVLADMPGVPLKKVAVDLKEGLLTISGEAAGPEGEETVLYEEYRVGRFLRQFRLSDVIDQGKIEATMKDGVLKLVLPKVGPARPKKIEVKSG